MLTDTILAALEFFAAPAECFSSVAKAENKCLISIEGMQER